MLPQLPQVPTLQSLQKAPVSVAIQRGHWEPRCMTVSKEVSQCNEHWSGKQCWNWRNQSVKTLTMPPNAHSLIRKCITTEASQGGVIALTTTKITRQHDIISFSQWKGCRQIIRFARVMAHGPAEKLSPHGKTISNRKGTSRLQHVRNVDSRSCAFWHRSHLLRFRPLLRPRLHRGAASNVPHQKASWVHKDGGLSLWW